MQLKPTHRARQGFTLIEVMVGMAVLLIGGLGALTGLAAASREMRDGQLRQYKMVLLDATAQRISLQDKELLIKAALTGIALPSTVSAISGAPWTLDATPLVAGDLGTGAYFEVLTNGIIRQLDATTTPAVAANTACSAVPQGVYCREVVNRLGAPVTSPGTIAAVGAVATVWIRVSRKGEPASHSVMTREVIVR